MPFRLEMNDGDGDDDNDDVVIVANAITLYNCIYIHNVLQMWYLD